MKKNQRITGILLLLLIGCNSASQEEQKNTLRYFDLKGYIQTEAARLQRQNPVVDKTVSIAENAENKKLKIADWAKELAILTDADINKAAWKGMFHIQQTKDEVSYSSDQEKVPVKQVRVRYKAGIPSEVMVCIKNTNLLYTSTDSIHYYPDSLYEIRKAQYIRLLSPKKYGVSIKFN